MMNEMTVLKGVIKGEMGMSSFGLKVVTNSKLNKEFLNSKFVFKGNDLIAESKSTKIVLPKGLVKNLLNELLDGKIDVVAIQ